MPTLADFLPKSFADKHNLSVGKREHVQTGGSAGAGTSVGETCDVCDCSLHEGNRVSQYSCCRTCYRVRSENEKVCEKPIKTSVPRLRPCSVCRNRCAGIAVHLKTRLPVCVDCVGTDPENTVNLYFVNDPISRLKMACFDHVCNKTLYDKFIANTDKTLFIRYIRNYAKKNKIRFAASGLDRMTEMLGGACCTCGCLPGTGENPFMNGLVMFDRTGGYCADNVVTMCGACMVLKQDDTITDFYERVRGMAKRNAVLPNDVATDRMSKDTKDIILASPCALCGRSPAGRCLDGRDMPACAACYGSVRALSGSWPAAVARHVRLIHDRRKWENARGPEEDGTAGAGPDRTKGEAYPAAANQNGASTTGNIPTVPS